jgi:hypothetical protein
MTEKEKVWFEEKKKIQAKVRIDNYYNDVKAIRKNIQFFFWLTVFSISCTIISWLF